MYVPWCRYGVLAIGAIFLVWLTKCTTSTTGALARSNGVEYVYEIPVGGPVRGAVFVAHGCSHSSTDWWPAGQHCLPCIGLPVEGLIVQTALSLGYAIIAVSSPNRQHKCWMATDVRRISDVLNHFYADKLFGNYLLPLYMIGASSGGSFVAHLSHSLALKPTVRAMCAQITSVRERSKVPIIFVLMERDEGTLAHVREKVANGYFAEHKILLVGPRPVGPEYLHATGAVDSKDVSENVHGALLERGFLDPSTLHLREDPRLSAWRQVRSRLSDMWRSCV
jgi:hypothetical protein